MWLSYAVWRLSLTKENASAQSPEQGSMERQRQRHPAKMPYGPYVLSTSEH